MKKHPNVELLKNSVQWQANLADTKWLGVIVYGVIVAVTFFQTLTMAASKPALILTALLTGLGMAVVYTLIFGVTLLVQWRSMTAQPEAYRIYTVNMDEPHQGWRAMVYFTVRFADENGNIQKRDTKSIFSSRNSKMEDYLNKTCKIAYNRETGQLVFLGLAE